MATIKIKALPETAAVEINETDVMIIEDKYKTKQIKVSELIQFILTEVQKYLDNNAMTEDKIKEMFDTIMSESQGQPTQSTNEGGE